jgi:hypothetical protein
VKVTADDIAQLLASAPPRQVPAHVLGVARGNRSNWSTALFGLFFGLFSVPFMWGFFPWHGLDELRLAAGTTTPGTVTQVTKTNMRVNGRLVMEYGFTYAGASGRTYTGACYADAARWSEGAAITIRYVERTPELAKIEGARLDKAGWFGLFVIIFPGVGFGMVAWFVFHRIQAGRLLRDGRMAEVDIVSVEATNTQVNKQPVFAITMTAPHLPAGRLTIKRLSQRDIALADRHLEQKQPLFVLYDPKKPKQMIFPEALLEQ